jgi:hypothetical protein
MANALVKVSEGAGSSAKVGFSSTANINFNLARSS